MHYYKQTGSVSLYRLSFTDPADTQRYTLDLKENSIGCYSTNNRQKSGLVRYIENPVASPPIIVSIPRNFCKLKLSVAAKTSEVQDLLIVKSCVSEESAIGKLIERKSSQIELSKLDRQQLPLDTNQTEQRFVINDDYGSKFQGNFYISLWAGNKMQFCIGVYIDERRSTKHDDEKSDSGHVMADRELDVDTWLKSPIEETFPLKSPIEECGGLKSPITTINLDREVDVTDMKARYDSPSKPAKIGNESDNVCLSASPQTPRKPERSAGGNLSFTVADFLNEFSFSIDDGPGFRSTLNRYETTLPAYKRTCASFLEELKRLESLVKRLSLCKVRITDLLTSLSYLQFSRVVRSRDLAADFERQFLSLFAPLERNMRFFFSEVCDPKIVQKIYTGITDASNSDLTKKFETMSKEYYAWLNKYLSNEKERPESKLLQKRKQFELSKFDYLNELSSVTNNQYVNHLLEQLLKFASLGKDPANAELLDFAQFRTSKTLLGDSHLAYLNALSRFNSEKHSLRQRIEACTSNEELTYIIRFNSLTNQAENDAKVSLDTLDQIFVPMPDMPTQIDPGEFSGILYALGGQGKPGWHKEWVVLNKGRLIEYSNWRTGTVPVHAPIEVALSSTKPVTHDRRQFCFEIMTSRGSRHVFQAINEDERNKWLKALYNAGQIVDRKRLEKSNADYMAPNLKVVTQFEKPVVPTDSAASPVSITSRAPESKDYISLVRSIPDSDNDICVDCGGKDSVEWISINFLVVFCVDCASAHRNLGVQVSKVRSLRLDKFENEVEILLKYINNRRANAYLEGKGSTKPGVKNVSPNQSPNLHNLHETQKGMGSPKLTTALPQKPLPALSRSPSIPVKDGSKPSMLHRSPSMPSKSTKPSSPVVQKAMASPTLPFTPDDAKFQYVRQKYAERRFAIDVPNINHALIKAVQRIGIEDVLKLLSCGANTALNVQMQGNKVVSLFAYSLRKYVEIDSKRFFVVSELLVLFGCKLEQDIDGLDISDQGKHYLERKLSQL